MANRVLLSLDTQKCFDTRKESLGTRSEAESCWYFLERVWIFLRLGSNSTTLLVQYYCFLPESPCCCLTRLQRFCSIWPQPKCLKFSRPTRWFRPDTTAFDLSEIRRPYNSNYVPSPKVVSWVTNTSHQVTDRETEAIEYWSLQCTSTVQFLVEYKFSKKWNISSNCLTCSVAESHNASLNKHYITETFNDPLGVTSSVK